MNEPSTLANHQSNIPSQRRSPLHPMILLLDGVVAAAGWYERHRKNILGLEGHVKQETVQTVLFLEFCLEQCEPLASILCIWYSGTRTHGHLSGIAQTLHKNTCVYVCGSVNLKFRVRKSSRSFFEQCSDAGSFFENELVVFRTQWNHASCRRW